MNSKATEIHPDFSAPSLKTQLLFEIKSWIGRKFLRKKSEFLPYRYPFLIDLGAGDNYTDGWTHVDFYRIRIKFWKTNKKMRKPEVETDFRYPFNCADNVADGIYTCHTLEHLYPNQAYLFLSEIFRILKPGCWLRIIVPDMRKIVEYYNGNNDLFDFKYRIEAISHSTQNYGHHSAWDEELLTSVLKLHGFINIKCVEYGKEGTDSRLIKETETRKFESLAMEAQKPL